jgi:hypothetical protein
MDCREFHEQHLAFVDDTLAGVELVRMQIHMNECDACSRHDATIRRSLMLFRNLPRIEPSPDFSRKLEMKLREVKLAEAAAANHRSNFGFKAGVTVASAVMLAYIGISLRQFDTPQDIVLPPVVATATTSEISTGGPAPEMIAAAPAGIPIWTAALFAEQTPSHFASIQLVSSTR